jgi:predicted Zn-dependent protease
MNRAPKLLARAAAMAAAALLSVQTAVAQSILRDAETEALFDDMSSPLIKAAGLDPGNVDIVLINDSSVNAFVAGGQAVYINSGLISSADSANQVQGVIAHELGHVTGGHAIAIGDGARAATSISLLSMLIGVAAALAGAGEAAMAGMALGQQAALGKFLAFSRTQESAADAAGAAYLSKAGISGHGSLEFFKKLQNEAFRYGYTFKDEDAYYQTHPFPGDRIARLTETYQVDPAWKKPDDAALEKRFQLVRAKLYGYLAEPQQTLVLYPESVKTAPARYARAYAFHKAALIDKAMAEAEALLASEPDNPYFLEIKGQILLESGKPREALAPLRRATQLTGNQPLIATTFGHALIATEDKDNFAEAERVLKAAVARDRDNPFAWYQLGVVYEARGDTPRAQLASAEQQVLGRQMPRALASAQMAQAGLPRGSPDWLRAQDIAFEARTAIESEKKRR